MTNRPELPDVNVLVSLLQPSHTGHREALEWFDTVDSYVTTPLTETGFLRLALNPRVMGTEIAPTTAMASLLSLRTDPRATFVSDGSTLAEAAIDVRGLAGHRQVTEFHLVNLAVRNGLVLTTFDRALHGALMPSDRGHVRVLG